MPNIRVDLRTKEIVRQLAADMGVSMTEVMRRAAKVYREELEQREAREREWAERQRLHGQGGGKGPEEGT